MWSPQGSLLQIMLFFLLFKRGLKTIPLIKCPSELNGQHSFIAQEGGAVRGGGWQRMGWTVCSSEILGRSDQANYSNISWKEMAVLALSAQLIYGALVIPKWAVSGKEFPISLLYLASLKALFFFFFHMSSRLSPHMSFAVCGSLDVLAGFVICC